MAAPAKTGSSKNSKQRFRYLGDKKVQPVMTTGGKMIGYVDGEAVIDKNGKEIPFKQIGELR